MKETADVVAFGLSRIVKFLVKLAIFPEEYKIARLIPLFKGALSGLRQLIKAL